MTLTIPRIKLAAAVLLLAAIALPQYTCARYHGPDGAVWDAIPPGADSSAYHPFRESHYAVEAFGFTRWETWVTIAAFAWPLALAVARPRLPARLGRVIWWFEPALAVISGYLILLFSSLGDRAVGAYLAVGALAVLLAAWVAELVRRLRRLA